MRLGWAKKGKYISYYAQKTIYVDGKNKSMVVKRFGSEKHLCETYGVTDAKAWAKEQVALMNEIELKGTAPISVDFSPLSDLCENQQRCFNGGYLFLQDIYHELGLDKISTAIAKKHDFKYNLNSILSRLIFSRILFPSSKLGTFEDSHKFMEQPDFELHQIYPALSVIAQESHYIQSRLFKNSMKISKRKTGVIYYDCTNFCFELEQGEDDKQFGLSKENRPLPMVEMGLFMDAEGFPLAFSINPQNQNQQPSLIPLEEKLLTNFDLSKIVICTHAGLSSTSNRKFNDHVEGNRDFITTQPVKQLKRHQQNWALSREGWKLSGGDPKFLYDISKLNEKEDKDKIYYKNRWIKEDGLKQQLIVTFSLKYKEYQGTIRSNQLERALKAVNQESQYDGFYAICTNLEDEAQSIVTINRRRWEIEECFRTMKSEFEPRPIYLHDKERIKAHLATCFITLIVYRYLEKKLDDRYTCSQILDSLREMNFLKFKGKGYIPTYTRTELTDALHDAFGFHTSKEIIPINKMRNICAQTKK